MVGTQDSVEPLIRVELQHRRHVSGAVIVESLMEMAGSSRHIPQMHESDTVLPLVETVANISPHSHICPLAECEAVGRAVAERQREIDMLGTGEETAYTLNAGDRRIVRMKPHPHPGLFSSRNHL